MATIRLCDWTKARLGKDEKSYNITIGGFETDGDGDVDEHEFEVGVVGMKALLKQLEGEEAPGVLEVKIVEKIVKREAPPPSLIGVAPGGLDVEVSGEPFEPGPSSMPQPVQGNADDLSMPNTAVGDDGVPPIEIPVISAKKRLAMPTAAQRDKIIAESTVFEEGSLPSLTMGGQKQKEAMRKLRAIEAQKEKELQRSARGGVRVNTDIRDKPGYHD